MLQQRYEEALAAYQEARSSLTPWASQALWQSRGIKSAWYTGTHDSLNRLSRPIGNHSPLRCNSKTALVKPTVCSELGNLYDDMGRLEEAVDLLPPGCGYLCHSADLMAEGVARNNLASTLIKLQRYDEARQELHRAIECKKPFGHAAEPWKTWALLYNLEQATGNAPAAADAWQQAVQCYLAYRRDGGESQEPGAQLCAQIAHAIRQGDTTEVTQFLAQAAAAADTPARLKAMLPKLHAILHGDRDPALAADPALDYRRCCGAAPAVGDAGSGVNGKQRSAISSQRDKEKQRVENLCYPDEYAVDSPISLLLLNPAS